MKLFVFPSRLRPLYSTYFAGLAGMFCAMMFCVAVLSGIVAENAGSVPVNMGVSSGSGHSNKSDDGKIRKKRHHRHKHHGDGKFGRSAGKARKTSHRVLEGQASSRAGGASAVLTGAALAGNARESPPEQADKISDGSLQEPVSDREAEPDDLTETSFDKGGETGLPLPRFASLRADRVYMRRGPGERYPVDWVYHRRGLPVQIEREFGVWRLVEDSEGQKGWVHQVTLRGTRGFVIPGAASSFTALPRQSASADNSMQLDPVLERRDGGKTKTAPTANHADSRIVGYISSQDLSGNLGHGVLLMSSPLPDQRVVAVLEPGTVGVIEACPVHSVWCHVKVGGYDGWLERRSLWGIQPDEIIQPG